LIGRRITSAGELGGSEAGAGDDEGNELAQPQRHQRLAGASLPATEARHCPPRQRFSACLKREGTARSASTTCVLLGVGRLMRAPGSVVATPVDQPSDGTESIPIF
jgi:hypothetical protein